VDTLASAFYGAAVAVDPAAFCARQLLTQYRPYLGVCGLAEIQTRVPIMLAAIVGAVCSGGWPATEVDFELARKQLLHHSSPLRPKFHMRKWSWNFGLKQVLELCHRHPGGAAQRA
jgi:hypothetical protein